MSSTHISLLNDVQESPRSSDHNVGALLKFVHLVPRRNAAVDDNRANHRAVRKLPRLVVNLRYQLASRADDDCLRLLDLGECTASDTGAAHLGEHWKQEGGLFETSDHTYKHSLTY